MGTASPFRMPLSISLSPPPVMGTIWHSLLAPAPLWDHGQAGRAKGGGLLVRPSPRDVRLSFPTSHTHHIYICVYRKQAIRNPRHTRCFSMFCFVWPCSGNPAG